MWMASFFTASWKRPIFTFWPLSIPIISHRHHMPIDFFIKMCPTIANDQLKVIFALGIWWLFILWLLKNQVRPKNKPKTNYVNKSTCHPLSRPAYGLNQRGEYVEQHKSKFGLGKDLVLAQNGVKSSTFFSKMTTFSRKCWYVEGDISETAWNCAKRLHIWPNDI